MDHEDQYNQNVDLENFDFIHMVLNEKSVLQIKSKERLNDNATYGFTLSQNLFSEDEINFEGYGVRLWMTAVIHNRTPYPSKFISSSLKRF